MTIDTERIRDAAEVLDTLTSQLPTGHPLRADVDARAKNCVAALYSAADAIDAQAAEIGRLREALTALVSDINGLLDESDGVYGLHLNGDPSPWEELIPGGRFERLTSLHDAEATLQGEPK